MMNINGMPHRYDEKIIENQRSFHDFLCNLPSILQQARHSLQAEFRAQRAKKGIQYQFSVEKSHTSKFPVKLLFFASILFTR